MLFRSGSIYENITMGNQDISEADVEAVARDIGLMDRLGQLTQGLHTKVGQGGQQLSGGQRQLVAMARAIVKDSPCIVVDEATANLDLFSEQHLINSLDKALKNKGAIIVAHRLSTIKNMDRILVVDKGQIIQEGSHEQLIAVEGKYRNLVQGGILSE